MEHVILRTSPFMETLFAFGGEMRQGRLALPIGQGRFAPLSVDDLSHFACWILAHRKNHVTAQFDLTGNQRNFCIYSCY